MKISIKSIIKKYTVTSYEAILCGIGFFVLSFVLAVACSSFSISTLVAVVGVMGIISVIVGIILSVTGN